MALLLTDIDAKGLRGESQLLHQLLYTKQDDG
jgi:hypothetical protein